MPNKKGNPHLQPFKIVRATFKQGMPKKSATYIHPYKHEGYTKDTRRIYEGYTKDNPILEHSTQ